MAETFKAQALRSREKLTALRDRLIPTEVGAAPHQPDAAISNHPSRSGSSSSPSIVEHIDRNIASLRLWELTLEQTSSNVGSSRAGHNVLFTSVVDSSLIGTLLQLIGQANALARAIDTIYDCVQKLNNISPTAEEATLELNTSLSREPTAEDKIRLTYDFDKRIRANYFIQECATVLSGYEGRRPWRLADVTFLWASLPKLAGVPPNSIDSRDNPPGILFTAKHVTDTEVTLGCFCDAWKDFLKDRPQADDISSIRNMARIILTLSIIKGGRPCLELFLKRGVTDSKFPFHPNTLLGIFGSDNDRLRKFFNGQQYRIAGREWKTGHMKFAECEPPPLKPWGRRRETYGSFGVVDQVQDVNTNEFFARKMMSSTPGSRPQMENEITTLTNLSESSKEHHIVEMIRSYERPPDQFGFLLKPIADSNLEEFLKEFCQNDPSTQEKDRVALLRAFGCLSRALRYLHKEATMRHRDVKPGNILYHDRKEARPENQQFVWADFGSAYDFSYQQGSVTYNPLFGRTKEYQAPEVLHRNKPHGTKSDIFSFGCVWLEILNVLLIGSVDETLKNTVVSKQPYSNNLQDLYKWIDDGIAETSDPVIKELLVLGKELVLTAPNDRPTMDKVVSELAKIAHKYKAKLFCMECYQQVQNENPSLEKDAGGSSKHHEPRGFSKLKAKWKS